MPGVIIPYKVKIANKNTEWFENGIRNFVAPDNTCDPE